MRYEHDIVEIEKNEMCELFVCFDTHCSILVFCTENNELMIVSWQCDNTDILKMSVEIITANYLLRNDLLFKIIRSTAQITFQEIVTDGNCVFSCLSVCACHLLKAVNGDTL